MIGLDVDAQALESLKASLDEAGIPGSVQRCDITDEAACTQVAQQIVNDFGGVDLLVNNAGITHFSRFSETSAKTARRVIEVNFMGSVNMTMALLPELIRAKGAIIAMSSVAGFAPLYARTLYSASKHAIHGFFNSLRTELIDDGVQVMIVCPSFIATQGASSAAKPDAAGNANDSGVARPGQATETAGKPLDPDFVAGEIATGILKKKPLLIVGPLARKSYLVYKFLPSLYERVMLKKIRGEVS